MKIRATDKSTRSEETSLATIEDFAEWVEQGALPEMTATQQKRSLKTALALVEAGWMLLRECSIDDLSIEAICASAGTTVGAFYGRFENKHAFFLTLQRVYSVRAQKKLDHFLARPHHSDATLEEISIEMVRETVERYRDGMGVKRSSLQHTREGMWKPFRDAGERFRAALSEHLACHLQHLPPKQRTMRICFAHQVLMGALVHATLNDPGPLKLADDAIVIELARMMCAYLQAPA